LENARRIASRLRPRRAFIIRLPKCLVICYLHIIHAWCLDGIIRPDRPTLQLTCDRLFFFSGVLTSRFTYKQSVERGTRSLLNKQLNERATSSFCCWIILHKLKVAICALRPINFLVDRSSGHEAIALQLRPRCFCRSTSRRGKTFNARNEVIVLFILFLRCRSLKFCATHANSIVRNAVGGAGVFG